MRILSSADKLFRRTTAGFRTSPDFLIVGAQKAGSTSLYDYMVQHPQIGSARIKEIHFFSRFYTKGFNWYKSNFPLGIEKKITGEATPYYLYHPLSAERIHFHLPNIKLIVVLREPVSRALSHYQHARKHGFENKPIMEALKCDLAKYEEYKKRIVEGENVFEYQEKSYVTRGYYQQQLDRYYDLFDEKNILILQSTDLFSNSSETTKQAFEFLQLDATFTPNDLSVKNKGDVSLLDQRSRDEAKEWLEEHYQPFNKLLLEKYDIQFQE